MHTDLERLIRLQRLDDATARARQTIADMPAQIAALETRLSRYKDQLMEVKTNKEYQAMQHEIATADREVRATEDRILDRMEEGEALTRGINGVEAALAAERSAVSEEKQRLERERVELEAQISRAAAERAAGPARRA